MRSLRSAPVAAGLALLLFAACNTPDGPPEEAPVRETVRDNRDVIRVGPGELIRPSNEDGTVTIRNRVGVIVDLRGASLRGASRGTDLDILEGYGIVIDGCRDVTVRGGSVGGYRACVVITESENVTVEDVSFEEWRSQRLRSNVAAEDLGDWLRPHDNDEGEWLDRYGAAISITDCKNVVVRGCTGRRGQNGVLLTRTEGAQIYDNDFSFLSGWGIALYRSSRNTISRNITDYCVRGYSHGVYSRGQDSAGILLFERSCENIVAFNSATHSGDGIFLFAGLDLVEGRAAGRGEEGDPGGSDGNLFYGNDLRFSPANGWEGTFSSRNIVVANDLSGCAQHGVWGGYSSELVVMNNVIDDSVGGGVTIEHGQNCVISSNQLRGNSKAVELYWDADPQFVDGPYGQVRDTRSRGSWILDNTFSGNTQDLVLSSTTEVTLFGNDWDDSSRRPHLDGLSSAGEDSRDEETVLLWISDRDGALPSGRLTDTTVSEWTGRGPLLLEELGAISAPKVPGIQEVRAERRGVSTGDRSSIVMGEWGPWDFRSGEPRPQPVLPGGILAGARWDARWFNWSDEVDPRGDLDAWRALAGEPAYQAEVSNWIDPWGSDEVRRAVGSSRFGLIAKTRVRTEEGTYTLSVTSDDGVRVMVNGMEVFVDWTWHAPRRAEVDMKLPVGVHEVVVEYFQIDGAAALLVELEGKN